MHLVQQVSCGVDSPQSTPMNSALSIRCTTDKLNRTKLAYICQGKLLNRVNAPLFY